MGVSLWELFLGGWDARNPINYDIKWNGVDVNLFYGYIKRVKGVFFCIFPSRVDKPN